MCRFVAILMVLVLNLSGLWDWTQLLVFPSFACSRFCQTGVYDLAFCCLFYGFIARFERLRDRTQLLVFASFVYSWFCQTALQTVWPFIHVNLSTAVSSCSSFKQLRDFDSCWILTIVVETVAAWKDGRQLFAFVTIVSFGWFQDGPIPRWLSHFRLILLLVSPGCCCLRRWAATVYFRYLCFFLVVSRRVYLDLAAILLQTLSRVILIR